MTVAPATADLTLKEALRRIAEAAAPLASETIPLNAALGRVLGEPVRAPEDQPAFDRSAMDGYAVRLDDDSRSFNVVDDLRAGDWRPRELNPGETVRIATGAALPAEGLQVIPQEETESQGDRVTVKQRESDRYIRFRGEDTRQGAPLLPAGRRLDEGGLALLAQAGVAHPRVARRPKVLHWRTGDELVAPDQTPAPGKIRDTNSTLVRAWLQGRGLEVRQQALPEEGPAALALAGDSAAEADLLLISGGASVGERDSATWLMEQLGYRVVFRRVRARPGRPLIFAARDRRLAFALPGNPLAHYVCLQVYVALALDRFAGLPRTRGTVTARVTAGIPATAGNRLLFSPGCARLRSGLLEVEPLPWRSSGDLTCLARTNALLELEPGPALEAGAEVRTRLTGPWLELAAGTQV